MLIHITLQPRKYMFFFAKFSNYFLTCLFKNKHFLKQSAHFCHVTGYWCNKNPH